MPRIRSTASSSKCGCAPRSPCGSVSTASLTTGSFSESPTVCRDWCSTAMARCWSGRSQPPAWKRSRIPSSRRCAHCSRPPRSTGRTIPARGSSSSCRNWRKRLSVRYPPTSPPSRRDCASRRRSRTDRRRAGSTTRRTTAHGWCVTALKAGAAAATCIDSSEAALDYARRNAQANGLTLEAIRSDAFEALKTLHEQGERFDVVVLDPPAFIKRKKDIPQGQAAYRKLNQLALALIEGEGLLVSCSCSYHLAPEDLVTAIQTAARHTSRFVQILESGGQSPDHPMHPAIPETRYLKAFFCRVTREVG